AKTLFADQRMREIDIVFNGESIRRIDTQGLVPIGQNEFLSDSNILPQPPLLHDTDSPDRLGVWEGTAVKNRNLEIVEFDVGVVDADSVQRRQKMLDGRNPHAMTHERGRIGDTRYRGNVGSQFEIVEIDAA